MYKGLAYFLILLYLDLYLFVLYLFVYQFIYYRWNSVFEV